MSNWQKLQQRLTNDGGRPAASTSTKKPPVPPAQRRRPHGAPAPDPAPSPSGLLDDRGALPTDVPAQLGGPLPAASLGPSSTAAEARQLEAVRALSSSFEKAAAQALGGRKWFTHFESWLWAARAEGIDSGDAFAAAVVSALPRAVSATGA
eukprot:6999709-Prymnesium_polylepis.1